jgi:hypothetical protein
MGFSGELEWLMIIGDLKFQNVRHVEAGGLLAKALRREEKNFFSFQFSVFGVWRRGGTFCLHRIVS